MRFDAENDGFKGRCEDSSPGPTQLTDELVAREDMQCDVAENFASEGKS